MRKTELLDYCTSVILASTGLVYVLVPLYKLYCKKSGFALSAQTNSIPPDQTCTNGRRFKLLLTSTVEKKLNWTFYPLQRSLDVPVGAPTLAFYRATNLSNEEVTGLATYNVLPQKAALHLNKIQCFCFEKQTLGPNEQVDMPVYFYIDSSINGVDSLRNLKEIILSYSFFKSNDQ